MKTWGKTSLNINEREGIERAIALLTKSFPINSVILFGSKARGDSDPHSDIDLLIICNGQLNWKQEKSIVEMLFDIGIEYDIIFSPLFTNVNEWEQGLFKEFPIYDEIVNDGALVQ